eukprot:TRINITY_DN58443_c0_g1_i1.p1 TRINITY_DN58443_c0_g1~~TRINITY_DN58443_c0_g1_i1.p1  ORF type:complete len:341 (-),score=76.97 TRINITY_DN58443_c0_g1_i1:381-1403(-)
MPGAADALFGTVVRGHATALRAALVQEAGGEDASPEDEAAIIWAHAVLMSRAYKLPKAGSKTQRLVLAPVIDLANSAETHGAANARLRAEKDGSVSLVAVRDLAEGEEVLTCYGEFDNEQLLFTYGYTKDGQNIQPVCPVEPSKDKTKAELWWLTSSALRPKAGHPGGLAKLRGADPTNQYAAPYPTACELLALLRVCNMTSDETGPLLAKWRRRLQQAAAVIDKDQHSAASKKSRQVFFEVPLALQPSSSELVPAAQILNHWRTELLDAIQRRSAVDKEVEAAGLAEHAKALETARKLQDETLEVVSRAREEVIAVLPLPFRMNWKLRDSFSNLTGSSS